ncbi:hypothetical protein R3I94_000755 [Phoxinus phoxinus]|uniref:Uncharacterized protein n=1 Tax=Phoxinus phoxinus TaxID=58324 RepID=A0AAN9DNG9_9TELE
MRLQQKNYLASVPTTNRKETLFHITKTAIKD